MMGTTNPTYFDNHNFSPVLFDMGTSAGGREYPIYSKPYGSNSYENDYRKFLPVHGLQSSGWYLKSSEIIDELEEIRKDISEWKADGFLIVEKSIDFAKELLRNSIFPEALPHPHLEIHPDGEIAFTWQKSGKGIFNIAFAPNGVATWAAYKDGACKRVYKGSFTVKDGMEAFEKNLLAQIIK